MPWVAQSLEAFTSKLFALSYSICTISVSSGNPADHLVHRHTHRVVRGALLAVGRPDGRLSALGTAENSVCLSVNQASSIQNMGITCESITLGHNPHKLPLAAACIELPDERQQFLCEVPELAAQHNKTKRRVSDELSVQQQQEPKHVLTSLPTFFKRGSAAEINGCQNGRSAEKRCSFQVAAERPLLRCSFLAAGPADVSAAKRRVTTSPPHSLDRTSFRRCLFRNKGVLRAWQDHFGCRRHP